MSFSGRKRQSEHINRRTTQSAFKAFDYAYDQGRPLNVYAVINLHETPEVSTAEIFERVLHKFRDWNNRATKKLTGKILSPFYVFTMENPAGTTHVNWAVNIDPQLQPEFEKKLRTWVERAQGRIGPFDVKTRAISQKWPEYKHLAKYILKGTDAAFTVHFFLDGVQAPQGWITGKRAGVSLALGLTARKAANFNGKRQRYAPRAETRNAGAYLHPPPSTVAPPHF